MRQLSNRVHRPATFVEYGRLTPTPRSSQCRKHIRFLKYVSCTCELLRQDVRRMAQSLLRERGCHLAHLSVFDRYWPCIRNPEPPDSTAWQNSGTAHNLLRRRISDEAFRDVDRIGCYSVHVCFRTCHGPGEAARRNHRID